MKKLNRTLLLQFVYIVALTLALSTAGSAAIITMGGEFYVLPTPDSDKDSYTLAQGDCNDEDFNIHPGAKEVCGDCIDQDCEGNDQVCATVDPEDCPVYVRAEYKAWIDADSDCQNTRAEVLIEESLVPLPSQCTVSTGSWYDPYTNIYFTSAASLDVDHLVAELWSSLVFERIMLKRQLC